MENKNSGQKERVLGLLPRVWDLRFRISVKHPVLLFFFSVGLGESFLAGHEARSGHFAKLGDEGGGDFSHKRG